MLLGRVGLLIKLDGGRPLAQQPEVLAAIVMVDTLFFLCILRTEWLVRVGQRLSRMHIVWFRCCDA